MTGELRRLESDVNAGAFVESDFIRWAAIAAMDASERNSARIQRATALLQAQLLALGGEVLILSATLLATFALST